MKKENNSLGCVVKIFDINAQKIVDFDVLKHQEDYIKKLKKKSATKSDFVEALRRDFQYRYWSRCEWELIIQKTDDGRILLLPWCGCSIPREVAIDVTDDTSFAWRSFAEHHIGRQNSKNTAKIDAYDQIVWSWPEVANRCWETRLRYERDDPKFHN